MKRLMICVLLLTGCATVDDALKEDFTVIKHVKSNASPMIQMFFGEIEYEACIYTGTCKVELINGSCIVTCEDEKKEVD